MQGRKEIKKILNEKRILVNDKVARRENLSVLLRIMAVLGDG